MAIKGKGKTKSRPAARAPRPTPVMRKPPFFLRRWVQVVLAMIAGAGIVIVVVWATNGLRSNDAADATAAKDAAASRVVQEWSTTVDGALSGVGPPPASGLGQVTVEQPLTDALATLGTPKEDPKANDTAAAAATALDTAATALQGVDLSKLITANEGVDLATTNYLLNSQARMVDGLQIYGRVAGLVTDATADGVDPAVADALIEQANKLVPLAKRVFDEGYTDYTSAKGSVGLLQPTSGIPGQIPGQVPGQQLPGGIQVPGQTGGAVQPGAPAS